MNPDLAVAPDAPSPLSSDAERIVERLGYAGLLPFVAGALLVWLVRSAEAHNFVVAALSAYAALIASFLGGIYWGLALRLPVPPRRWLLWGVTPSLLAWLALLLLPHAGLVLLALLLAGCYAVDRRLYPQAGLAHRLTMRFRLSAVSSLCCFIGAAGS